MNNSDPPISDKLRRQFEFVRLPENHYYAKINEVQETSVDISDWLENPKSKLGGKGLYLYGDYSRGKSSIAAIICKMLIYKGIFPFWLEYQDLAGYIINDTMFNDTTTMVRRAAEADFLICNEFNPKAYQKPMPIDCLDYVIRERVAAKKTTIITSNTSPGELKNDPKVGPMCQSLVAISREAFTSVLLEGKDLRK